LAGRADRDGLVIIPLALPPATFFVCALVLLFVVTWANVAAGAALAVAVAADAVAAVQSAACVATAKSTSAVEAAAETAAASRLAVDVAATLLLLLLLGPGRQDWREACASPHRRPSSTSHVLSSTRRLVA
jgi:uncharacterized membrane protein YphA (DoxX/SURF4 family)